jgi:hypothetical protein
MLTTTCHASPRVTLTSSDELVRTFEKPVSGRVSVERCPLPSTPSPQASFVSPGRRALVACSRRGS